MVGSEAPADAGQEPVVDVGLELVDVLVYRHLEGHDHVEVGGRVPGRAGAQRQLFSAEAQERCTTLPRAALTAVAHADIELGEKVGVDGTPSLFIAGKRVNNPNDLPGVKALIDAALAD